MFCLRLPNISKNLALMSFSRSAYAKSCDGFVPQETDFKRLALVLSSASARKKLAMVSSLKTMFQKRLMAPTFLSSSTTRRHNNARPPPAHTLLSAAAERSSYGLYGPYGPYLSCIPGLYGLDGPYLIFIPESEK